MLNSKYEKITCGQLDTNLPENSDQQIDFWWLSSIHMNVIFLSGFAMFIINPRQVTEYSFQDFSIMELL